MPNRIHIGQEWANCDRCGFQYPLNELTLQLGLRVCTRTCVDNLDTMYRQQEIAQTLDDGGTEYLLDKDEQFQAVGWDDLEL